METTATIKGSGLAIPVIGKSLKDLLRILDRTTIPIIKPIYQAVRPRIGEGYGNSVNGRSLEVRLVSQPRNSCQTSMNQKTTASPQPKRNTKIAAGFNHISTPIFPIGPGNRNRLSIFFS